VQPEPNVQGRI